MKTVSVTLDDLPPLSPERIAELRPLAERSRADQPLRDVAGMLRSFDYAAAVGGVADRGWLDAVRAAYLSAYEESSPERDGTGRRVATTLLAALAVAMGTTAPAAAITPEYADTLTAGQGILIGDGLCSIGFFGTNADGDRLAVTAGHCAEGVGDEVLGGRRGVVRGVGGLGHVPEVGESHGLVPVRRRALGPGRDAVPGDRSGLASLPWCPPVWCRPGEATRLAGSLWCGYSDR